MSVCFATPRLACETKAAYLSVCAAATADTTTAGVWSRKQGRSPRSQPKTSQPQNKVIIIKTVCIYIFEVIAP